MKKLSFFFLFLFLILFLVFNQKVYSLESTASVNIENSLPIIEIVKINVDELNVSFKVKISDANGLKDIKIVEIETDGKVISLVDNDGGLYEGTMEMEEMGIYEAEIIVKDKEEIVKIKQEFEIVKQENLVTAAFIQISEDERNIFTMMSSLWNKFLSIFS